MGATRRILGRGIPHYGSGSRAAAPARAVEAGIRPRRRPSGCRTGRRAARQRIPARWRAGPAAGRNDGEETRHAGAGGRPVAPQRHCGRGLPSAGPGCRAACAPRIGKAAASHPRPPAVPPPRLGCPAAEAPSGGKRETPPRRGATRRRLRGRPAHAGDRPAPARTLGRIAPARSDQAAQWRCRRTARPRRCSAAATGIAWSAGEIRGAGATRASAAPRRTPGERRPAAGVVLKTVPVRDRARHPAGPHLGAARGPPARPEHRRSGRPVPGPFDL